MPRIIVKAGYFKNGARNPHGKRYLEYIATREGVELLNEASAMKPATAAQREFIEKIVMQFPNVKLLDEYGDYMNCMTRGNASELISAAVEDNPSLIDSSKSYLDYIATRPRAERIGSHGLFSDVDTPLTLGEESKKLKAHTGNIWTVIVSLKREDAERLSFNSASRWRDFLASQKDVFAENLHIPVSELRWFGAFHNESHHPHCHLVFYADNPKLGYLSECGIENIRSKLANGIFEQDLECIYAEQSQRRDELTNEARAEIAELVMQLQSGINPNPQIAEKLYRLSELLQNVGGKKQYGYLPPYIKKLVNEITDELAEDERIKRLHELWYEKRYEVLNTYTDKLPPKILLSQQKEFKSIRNAVIKEALKLSQQNNVSASDSFKHSMALRGTINLLRHIGGIFHQQPELHGGKVEQLVDSKQRREIEEKKNAQSFGQEY